MRFKVLTVHPGRAEPVLRQALTRLQHTQHHVHTG